MADKVQKIRGEVEKLKSQLLRGACSSQISMETMCKEEAYNEVLAILDTMQEEPVSIDFEHELYKAFGQVKDFTLGMRIAKRFYDMGKNSQEPVSDDLGEYINELSKQFPEVSFAKLSRIAVRVAKWQKENMIKND